MQQQHPRAISRLSRGTAHPDAHTHVETSRHTVLPHPLHIGKRMRLSSRKKGILVAVLSIAFSSPDATLLRSLQGTHVSNLVIIAYKTFFVAWIQVIFAVWEQGTKSIALAFASWRHMIVGAACLTVAWLSTLANLTTSSASALCLFYIAPLWAVPMGVLVNREHMHWRTLASMVVALCGIVLVFSASLTASDPSHAAAKLTRPKHRQSDGAHGSHGQDSLLGDAFGFVSGLAFAAYLTCCRHASLYRPEAPLGLCGALGTLCVAVPTAALVIHRGEALFDVSGTFLGLLGLECCP